jgi:hypothetical protein
VPLHSGAPRSDSHAMKSFGLAVEPLCSGKKVLNKAAIMNENSNPGIMESASSARHRENCQNKPTAERSTVVEKEPRAQPEVENEATCAARPGWEPDDPRPARRAESSVDRSAHPGSYSSPTIVPQSSPGGGGPAMHRHWGELDSGWLDSPPSRI